MKTKFTILLFFLIFICSFSLKAQCYSDNFKEKFPEWKEEKYKAANTAEDIHHFGDEEKLFYYYLNLMRMNPVLFSKTFIESCKFSFLHEEKQRLYIAPILKKLKSVDPIFPYKAGCQYRNCEGKTNGKYIYGYGYKSIITIETSYPPNYSPKSNKDQYAFDKVISLFLEEKSRNIIFSENVFFDILFEQEKNKTLFTFKVFPNEEITFLPIQNQEKDQLEQYINHKENYEAIETEWKNIRYDSANTAKNATYLTKNEKMVYYYLNLARMNPALFAETFLKKYTAWNTYKIDSMSYVGGVSLYSGEYLSLYNTLKNMTPIALVYPNKKLYESAKCHAISSGKAGTTGSKRIEGSNCPKIEYHVIFYYDDNTTMKPSSSKSIRQVECYAYQETDALSIIMQILYSKNLSNTSQRDILLNGEYKKLGVAIAKHAEYEYGAILDFE